MELTLAITGASGAIYAYRMLLRLVTNQQVEQVNLIMSDAACIVARVELGIDLREGDGRAINEWLGLNETSKRVRVHRIKNLAAPPASGSYLQAGMIIAPCSMGTLGAIASGAGYNLIHRAADVTLKEGRKLIIVPREAPYNQIHLENMLRLSNAGARIIPASPSFYHRPQTIDELVDHLVFRILDQFGLGKDQTSRWGESESQASENESH